MFYETLSWLPLSLIFNDAVMLYLLIYRYEVSQQLATVTDRYLCYCMMA